MLGFITRTLGGAIAPLIDQVSIVSARLLRKAALFLVAALCLNATIIALTIAFFLWIARLANPIVGALAVAGLYLVIAVVAIVLALRDGSKKPAVAKDTPQAEAAARQAEAGIEAQIDKLIAPLLALLAQLGFRREQFAVLAGASIAKRLGPLPLVGLAVVGGFLVGRMWKTWRSVLSIDLIANLFSSSLFGGASTPSDEETTEEG